MSEISTEVILNRARDYFRVQLSKSLELAFLLPTDSKVDLGREVAGTKLFEAKLREELKYQCFSQSIQSDAFTLLHPTNPDPDAKSSDAFQIACNAILRAKIENARKLVARSCRPATVGDQRDSNNSDARKVAYFLTGVPHPVLQHRDTACRRRCTSGGACCGGRYHQADRHYKSLMRFTSDRPDDKLSHCEI
jgi:hypothetical protein